MVYALYQRTESDGHEHFVRQRDTCLFGCRRGLICNVLEKRRLPVQEHDVTWHIDVRAELRARGDEQGAFIIDLKPKDSKGNVSLYEVVNINGSSHTKWTPFMLHIRGLLVDADSKISKDDFHVPSKSVNEPLFTFLYAQGGIENGQIKGTWVPPGRSSTNSAVLWSGAFEFFFKHACRIRKGMGMDPLCADRLLQLDAIDSI